MHQKQYLYLLIALLFGISSCKKSVKKDLLLESDFKLTELSNPQKLALPDSLTKVHSPQMIGDYLLVSLPKNTHSFALLEKSNLELAMKLCPIGEGPEEFINGTAHPHQETQEIYVTEGDRSKLSIVDVKASLEAGKTVVKKQISFAKTGKRIEKIMGSKAPYAAYVFEGNNFSYYWLDPNKQATEDDRIGEVVSLPEAYKSKEMYYTQSYSTFNDKHSTMFVANLKFPRIDIVNKENQSISSTYLLEKLSPEAAVEFEMNRESRSWYTYFWGLAASDKNVFVGLWNGFSPSGMTNKNMIWVFDWEGNPMKALKLPFSATSFTVDSKEKELYVFHLNEEGNNEIYKFDL